MHYFNFGMCALTAQPALHNQKSRPAVWMPYYRASRPFFVCFFFFPLYVHLFDIARPIYSATLPINPPLAPISKCNTVSYGMALQCAETAEVMNTDRVHKALYAECQ